MRLTKGHKQLKCYADGGKVSKSARASAMAEYDAGLPTFGKAVKARLGMGDGYGKPNRGQSIYAQRIYKPVANAGKDLQNAVTNRKKMLDEI